MASPAMFDHEKLDVYQLLRVVSMLSKLIERFDPEQYRVGKNVSGVTQRFEHEDDDEREDQNRNYRSL